MSTLVEDQKAYYEAFRTELQAQLKRTFKMKRNLYEFAKECKIYMPYGLDKASSIMFVAEKLAKQEMRQRYGETEYDKIFEEQWKKLKPEDKVTKQYHGVGKASVVVKESDGKILETQSLPSVSAQKTRTTTMTTEEEKKQEQQKQQLLTVKEE